MTYLKTLRTKEQKSQQEVADYLGITRQAYSNYENGNRNPDNETLLKLAEYFDVTVDLILRGETAPADDPLERMRLMIDNLTPDQAVFLASVARIMIEALEKAKPDAFAVKCVK